MRRRTVSLLHSAFFLSGISSVVYQLVWQRDLFRLFGVNIESVTAVITAFMLGLGCGGLLGSWLSRRSLNAPLLVFAVMEATIAVFGLLSLRVFDWLGYLFGGSSLSIRTLVTVAVLLIPTGCMGATLPLLVGHAVKASVNVGASTGRLYYVNTLGAVVGCFLAAIYLFPFQGNSTALRIAACLNIVACCGAGVAYLRFARINQAKPTLFTAAMALPNPRSGLAVAYPLALIIAGLSGYLSLSYEIFFIHVTAFASGGNSVALVLMLASILLGIASGARAVSDQAKHNHTVPAHAFSSLTWASVIGLLVLPIMAHNDIFKVNLVFGLLPLAILIARALGTVFPLMAHMAVPPDTNAGFRVGLIYTMNVIGSTLGTLLTGFVLSQALGLRGLAILLAASTLCLAVLLAVSTGLLTGRRPGTLAAAGMVAAVVLMTSQRTLTTRLFDSMLSQIDANYVGTAREVIENRSGIVVVSQYGAVYGGGIYDGAFNIDPYRDINGIIRPYSLSLFHASPKQILMIGLASGSWAQVVANNPYVERLTVIEIDPAYLALIRREPVVQSLLINPKVTVAIDDGHRWLEAHPGEIFDAILVNTTYHFRANTSNLLSVEFDRLVRRHLNAGGVYLFNATGSIRAERTGCLSFRYGFRVLNNLMLSDSPFDLDVARWSRVLSAYTIDGQHMLPNETAQQSALFAHIIALPSEWDNQAIDPDNRRMESCESLLQRTAGMPLITDDNMGTEWRFPLLHRE